MMMRTNFPSSSLIWKEKDDGASKQQFASFPISKLKPCPVIPSPMKMIINPSQTIIGPNPFKASTSKETAQLEKLVLNPPPFKIINESRIVPPFILNSSDQKEFKTISFPQIQQSNINCDHLNLTASLTMNSFIPKMETNSVFPSQTPIIIKKCKSFKRTTFPEIAKREMKSWLISHFYYPYPTLQEKIDFARKYGLTEKQISVFFVNERIRLLNRKGWGSKRVVAVKQNKPHIKFNFHFK